MELEHKRLRLRSFVDIMIVLKICFSCLHFLLFVILVVGVVDDDTYYWVNLSSEHPFQVYYKVRQRFYYKVRQVLLQSATGIAKCDNFITKCDRTYVLFGALQVSNGSVKTLPHRLLVDMVICSMYIVYHWKQFLC